MSNFICLKPVFNVDSFRLHASSIDTLNLEHGMNLCGLWLAIDDQTGDVYANQKEFIDHHDNWIKVGSVNLDLLVTKQIWFSDRVSKK